MTYKSMTLDDLEGHWQSVWLAILATAGLLVIFGTFFTFMPCRTERITCGSVDERRAEVMTTNDLFGLLHRRRKRRVCSPFNTMQTAQCHVNAATKT